MKKNSIAKTFIIAEAGVNHNGRMDWARQLIDAAAWAGADAVKFQTFVTEYNQSHVHLPAQYLRWAKSLELSFDQFDVLSKYCRRKGILFLSTPFETKSADFLDQIGVPVFKISSGELTNHPLLQHVARKGKPIILSTGMSSIAEIKKAAQIVHDAFPNKRMKPTALSKEFTCLNEGLVLLHCVSEYPTPYAHANLRAMEEIRRNLHLPVGLSDHTLGVEVPIAASALGACVIEKHFTVDKKWKGPDQALSLSPQELKTMVDSIRHIEQALGSGQRALVAAEKKLIKVARKSIVASHDLVKGSVITSDMLYVMRPGRGIPPEQAKDLIGLRLLKNVRKDEMLSWSHLAKVNK